jgi:hypothetical protein
MRIDDFQAGNIGVMAGFSVKKSDTEYTGLISGKDAVCRLWIKSQGTPKGFSVSLPC